MLWESSQPLRVMLKLLKMITIQNTSSSFLVIFVRNNTLLINALLLWRYKEFGFKFIPLLNKLKLLNSLFNLQLIKWSNLYSIWFTPLFFQRVILMWFNQCHVWSIPLSLRRVTFTKQLNRFQYRSIPLFLRRVRCLLVTFSSLPVQNLLNPLLYYLDLSTVRSIELFKIS